MLFLPVDLWLLVLSAGAFLIVIGLMPTAGSGDRRCPECWYDMARVTGCRCPECNHERLDVADLYPTRPRWVLVAIGGLMATPGLFAVYEALFKDIEGRLTLVDYASLLRVIGVVMVVTGLWLLSRTARRWARAWRHDRASPHEWKALALIALLLAFHGLCVFILPRAAVLRWAVIPQPIREFFTHLVSGQPK